MPQTQQAVPPAELVEACALVQERPLVVTRDIVDSRQDWKTAACQCAAKFGRLVEWNTGKAVPENGACQEIKP